MGDKALENWTPRKRSLNRDLHAILLDRYRAENHGVLGSFSLLKLMKKALGTVSPHVVASALAIAIHDYDVREDMKRKRLLPISIEKFPLAKLLFYCDASHEWSREVQLPKSETYLCDISVRSERVCCELSFDNKITANRKMDEWVTLRECFRSGPLSLGLTIRIF